MNDEGGRKEEREKSSSGLHSPQRERERPERERERERERKKERKREFHMRNIMSMVMREKNNGRENQVKFLLPRLPHTSHTNKK
jgi:hypothetical protein